MNDDRRKEYFYELDYYNSLSTKITQGAAYIQKIRHYTTYTDGIQVGRIKSYLDNEIIIRLADIILLRAELKEKTGDQTGAKFDLNIIRQRANTSVYDENEGNLKEAIQNERDRELFLEGINTRFFDMVRTGMFREKLRGNFKTLIDQDVTDGAFSSHRRGSV
ncbi:MAG: RagB/SusD family nutrient uptake outer membrane protein [Butyricimonas faecihominis]